MRGTNEVSPSRLFQRAQFVIHDQLRPAISRRREARSAEMVVLTAFEYASSARKFRNQFRDLCRDWHRTRSVRPFLSIKFRLLSNFTKTGSVNSCREKHGRRTTFWLIHSQAVKRHSRTTLENNGKLSLSHWRENSFAKPSGGWGGPERQPSPRWRKHLSPLHLAQHSRAIRTL